MNDKDARETDRETTSSSLNLDGDYIREGTWLQDRTPHALHTIGVVTKIQERDDIFDTRLGIRWRDHSYENTSVMLFIERLKRGEVKIER